ncbi:hypothetical protein ACFSJU_11650 [Paradesertivirga mongoliensis]|uniref:Uncharacterized protein n=2 Tax=Paradesertivirga mongoliensis TaxID=2100740 RepID=A0ABW4ZMC8_9SPHI
MPVSIPANSSAEIYRPASSLKDIEEGNKAISTIKEIEYLHNVKGSLVLKCLQAIMCLNFKNE